MLVPLILNFKELLHKIVPELVVLVQLVVEHLLQSMIPAGNKQSTACAEESTDPVEACPCLVGAGSWPACASAMGAKTERARALGTQEKTGDIHYPYSLAALLTSDTRSESSNK
jgi:hypothetical protein